MLRDLAREPLILLGEASYSIYILQVPFFSLFTLLVITKGPIAFACYLVILIASSIVCFRYFETPLRRLLVVQMPVVTVLRSYLETSSGLDHRAISFGRVEGSAFVVPCESVPESKRDTDPSIASQRCRCMLRGLAACD